MDGAAFNNEMETLLGALRRRSPVLDEQQYTARLAGALAGLETAAAGTVTQLLTGHRLLSQYRERDALVAFDAAGGQLAPLLQRNPDAGDLNELAALIAEGQTEAHYVLGDYEQAGGLAAHLWTRRMSTADLRAKARAATWVGCTQQQTGRYQDGLRMLGRAVADFELAGVPAEAGRALNALACLHEELGDFDRAFALYESALKRARDEGNADMVGRVLANWGDAHVERGTPESGLPLLTEAIAVLQPIGAHWHYAWCQLSAGKVYAARGEFEQAVAMHAEALASVRKSDAPRIECEILTGTGELAAQMGDAEAACRHLDAALELSRKLGIEREVMRCHGALAAVHRKFGRYKRALQHFEAYHEIHTRIYESAARARMEQLEGQVEFERAKRERELSQLRNVELANALEEVRQLNSELLEKARVLEELSNHDPLTGLHNRRYLYSRIAAEIQRFQRYGTRFSVAIYDVDHFKQVNDQYTHAVGDEVLLTLARLVDSALRESDVHARFGGEEFAVILPSAGAEEARRVMEKLREVVAGFEWEVLAPGLQVTISAGVAEIAADEEATPLINRADAMLYEAKRAGRNCVHG